MSLPTSSTTLLDVEDAIVSLLDTALAAPVTYAWPGAAAESTCVFLGPHPETLDLRVDMSTSDPTIKAGRRQSQETYEVMVTVWSFRPDLTAQDARTAAGEAKLLVDEVTDAARDDHTFGVDGVLRSEVSRQERVLFPFHKGWACEWRVWIEVTARLR